MNDDEKNKIKNWKEAENIDKEFEKKREKWEDFKNNIQPTMFTIQIPPKS